LFFCNDKFMQILIFEIFNYVERNFFSNSWMVRKGTFVGT